MSLSLSSSLILVLYLSIIRPDTFRPVLKLVIFSRPWIGQPEQVVLVKAYRGTEPAGFKDGLRQYHFRMLDAILYYFRIKVWNGQRRKRIVPALHF